MKLIILSFVAVLCLFGSDAIAQTPKQKLAVYVTGDVDSGYKKVIGSKLVYGITNSYNYAAVERTSDFLSELTKEQDYQMSGAVSDNQIARLGQQFGVRYVLVADVSEIFEELFISARMIDVQTAQITKSAEASQAVNNMQSLAGIAEKVALEIIETPAIPEESIKLLGPFSTFDQLYEFRIPEGYHCATKDEIEDIIKIYKAKGKEVSFPIYANTQTNYCSEDVPFIIYNNAIGSQTKAHRLIKTKRITCTFIKNVTESTIIDLVSKEDNAYNENFNQFRTWNNESFQTLGLHDESIPPPSITAGYVYVIKDKVTNGKN